MPRANRPVVVLGVMLTALTAVVGVSQWRAAHRHDLIPWRTDLAAAEREAASQHKRVFAYFTANWCGPCQEMKSTTWADPDVRDSIIKRFVPVKIDVDDQKQLALKYEIDSMPSFVVLSATGEPARRESGYLDEAAMVAWVSR